MTPTQKVLRGTALGDAIGHPLEFEGYPTTPQWAAALEGPFYVTDDTQMMLFCHQGQMWNLQPMEVNVMLESYLDWYRTQTMPFRPGGRGLLAHRELWYPRAPGNTCMTSLRQLIANQERRPRNDSKGNGTVMRCAPIGTLGAAWGRSAEWVADTAVLDATITHDHPLARNGSAFWALLHWHMAQGFPLREGIAATREFLKFDTSVFTRCMDMPASQFSKYRLAVGAWVAEEAVAVALRAVADATDWLEAVEAAARIKGDSDTVASMVGGLATHLFPIPGLGPTDVDSLLADLA